MKPWMFQLGDTLDNLTCDWEDGEITRAQRMGPLGSEWKQQEHTGGNS